MFTKQGFRRKKDLKGSPERKGLVDKVSIKDFQPKAAGNAQRGRSGELVFPQAIV